MAKQKLDWGKIDTVLLDMDGTLIDQHHEDYFWDSLLPKAYARKNKIPFSKALEELYALYRAKHGTANWGDIHAWGKTLGMDLVPLRKKIKPYVKLHPHTVRFLKFLKKHKKKVYLVTAAADHDIDFEMAITKIGRYFNGVYTQPQFGISKQNPAFWKKVIESAKLDPVKTVAVDDREEMLIASKVAGIRHLVLKTKYSSRKPVKDVVAKDAGIIKVHHLDDLLP